MREIRRASEGQTAPENRVRIFSAQKPLSPVDRLFLASHKKDRRGIHLSANSALCYKIPPITETSCHLSALPVVCEGEEKPPLLGRPSPFTRQTATYPIRGNGPLESNPRPFTGPNVEKGPFIALFWEGISVIGGIQMIDKQVVRALWRLANRLDTNASQIRNANLPHHLTTPRKRMLRHLRELNHVRDRWADTHKPARRQRYNPRPQCACDSAGRFQWPKRIRRSV